MTGKCIGTFHLFEISTKRFGVLWESGDSCFCGAAKYDEKGKVVSNA